MSVIHVWRNLQVNKELLYYKYIMGESDSSIQNVFHKKWITFLDSINMPYSKALQLRIGSHLRPLLVYWGYFLGKKEDDEQELNQITELALCVEIIHKVSIIVDDLIDKDIRRHNASTFHIQYSAEETIIFAVYMIGIAFEKLNMIAQKYPKASGFSAKMYAQTLRIMSEGCLQELLLNSKSRYDLTKIHNIISMETSTLIKNSLLSGFTFVIPQNNTSVQLIKQIGDKVGYLFQVMNDMEPFTSASRLTIHKGTLNLDFERSRKNMVLPYIYGSCSVQEKERLVSLSENNTEYMLELYFKYKIEQLMLNDITRIENQIDNIFVTLEQQPINIYCLKDFIRFYKKIMEIGKSRLHQASHEPID